MESRILFAVVAVAVTLGSACSSLAQEATPAKLAEIWYTEQLTVHSESLGRDFLIQVAKPVKPQSGKVPVIYLLDGNGLFGQVANLAIASGYFGPTAAYVVGIGYPDQDYGQWLGLRAHDFLSGPLPPALQHSPVAASIKSAADSAGGAGFQKFLLQELRPIIERRYAVDPQRSILAGHSLGALFASHVMLNAAGAFNEYLLCSPSIWLEPQLLDKASAFSSALPLRVFVGFGSKEDDQLAEGHMSKNAQELVARLRNHASGTDVSLMTFEGRDHGTSLPDCLSQGLLTLLPVPPATTSR